jgi:hypothetical protein
MISPSCVYYNIHQGVYIFDDYIQGGEWPDEDYSAEKIPYKHSPAGFFEGKPVARRTVLQVVAYGIYPEQIINTKRDKAEQYQRQYAPRFSTVLYPGIASLLSETPCA